MMSKNIQGFLESQRLSNTPGHSRCDVHLKRFKMTAKLPVRIFKVQLMVTCGVLDTNVFFSVCCTLIVTEHVTVIYY